MSQKVSVQKEIQWKKRYCMNLPVTFNFVNVTFPVPESPAKCSHDFNVASANDVFRAPSKKVEKESMKQLIYVRLTSINNWW